MFDVPKDMVHKWLYYETGFEQFHPIPDIIRWMEEQGYLYGRDWKVDTFTGHKYYIIFPNDEIAALFVARWSA
jgi:hypothetical protein